MKNLSVVNAVPAQYEKWIDLLAEAYGCGSNSMSVNAVDADGNKWTMCHSYWEVEDYAIFSSDELRNAFIDTLDDKDEILKAVDNLKERCVLNGIPYENRDLALQEWQLTIEPSD